jgi:cyclophilin family peptidyl-prolyl cis-trans isomerase
MRKFPFILFGCLLLDACNPKIGDGLRRNDLGKDVEMSTTRGTIVIRLSDSTPLHRNNFLKLAKEHYYDSLLFHRVIARFMVQAGDPASRRAKPEEMLGAGGPAYTIPAEIRPGLFHHRGVIAAAREGDDVNPAKASSGSQFYIVQGRKFTDAGLDSVEIYRKHGQKIPPYQRQVYKAQGGAPHLDGNYTVFGELVSGWEVIDSIAASPTSGREGGDRPLKDIRILGTRLISRHP